MPARPRFLLASAVMPPSLTHLDLMHPTLYAKPFSAPGWLFELKVDGFRALARKQEGQVELRSRNGRSLAPAFPEIINALARIPGDWTLDAELVVPDKRGHPSFGRLQRRALMRLHTSQTRGVALDHQDDP